MLNFIHDHLDEFGPIVDCTLKQLGLGYYRPPSEFVSFSNESFLVILIDVDSLL